ncbi:MAG: hypothetical protein IJ071_08095 [Ruminococcus sp.]|nr:hypothetical protein [Ruminococcus sp.]
MKSYEELERNAYMKAEKMIAEKKRRDKIIRRSAVSSGACAAAIAGVWLMSVDGLRDAAKPPHTEVVITETTAVPTLPEGTSAPSTEPPATEPHPVKTTAAASAIVQSTAARTAASTERAAHTVTEAAAVTAPERTVQTAPVTERTSAATAASLATDTAAQTTPVTAPATQTSPAVTSNIITTIVTDDPGSIPDEPTPLGTTTRVQSGTYLYDPKKTYSFSLDGTSYEVSGERVYEEDLQDMTMINYTSLYTTDFFGKTIAVEALLAHAQTTTETHPDLIVCSVQTSEGQAYFIARPIG